MTIIILSITKYKEKDGIINCLTEKGIQSFTVKGILDPNSKTNVLNNILTIADVDFVDGDYKYPLIKRNKVIISALNLHSDLRYMSCVMGLSESCLHLLMEEDLPKVYPMLYQSILALKSGINPLIILLIFLSQVIKISGYEFETNKCVCCGSNKNIAAFSFNEGGFVCRNCLRSDIKNDLNVNQLKLVRLAFMSKDFSIKTDQYQNEDIIYLLQKYSIFIEDNLGYKLNSLIMLDK